MSQIQTTLKPKDIEAVKYKAIMLLSLKLSQLYDKQDSLVKGSRAGTYTEERHTLNEGEAAQKCLFTYHKYWLKLEAKIMDAPLCSKDGIEYMKKMQTRTEYACKWIMQNRETQLKAFYAKNPHLFNLLEGH